MTDNSERITTIETALEWSVAALDDASESARLDARLLLCDVLQVKPEYLIRYPERALTIDQTAAFNRVVGERAKGIPIAYLLGRQGFFNIEVYVTPGVLIPRPETELLVEKALEWARDRHAFITDVGTGSGAIALAVAHNLPTAHVTGIDISETALDVARRSAEKLNLQRRVRWLQGNLLTPLIDQREQTDLILANLPYIPSEALAELEVAQHEPALALDGGADGLDPIRQLLTQAPQVLRPNGRILLEIGYDQGAATRQLVAQVFPQFQVLALDQDLAGHDRLMTLTYASST
jgi:release factor glutamine methyltransferase